MNEELRNYLETHDIDEEDAELLEEWVNAGNSINENPFHEYDDYGVEVPFMKWYWRQQDRRHPESRRKILLKEAMRTAIKFDDSVEERRFLKNAQYTLVNEILMYRRFLAHYSGAVEAFEHYRSQEAGD